MKLESQEKKKRKQRSTAIIKHACMHIYHNKDSHSVGFELGVLVERYIRVLEKREEALSRWCYFENPKIGNLMK